MATHYCFVAWKTGEASLTYVPRALQMESITGVLILNQHCRRTRKNTLKRFGVLKIHVLLMFRNLDNMRWCTRLFHGEGLEFLWQ